MPDGSKHGGSDCPFGAVLAPGDSVGWTSNGSSQGSVGSIDNNSCAANGLCGLPFRAQLRRPRRRLADLLRVRRGARRAGPAGSVAGGCARPTGASRELQVCKQTRVGPEQASCVQWCLAIEWCVVRERYRTVLQRFVTTQQHSTAGTGEEIGHASAAPSSTVSDACRIGRYICHVHVVPTTVP